MSGWQPSGGRTPRGGPDGAGPGQADPVRADPNRPAPPAAAPGGRQQPGIPRAGNPRSRTPVPLGPVRGGGRTFGDVLKGLGALLLLGMLVVGAPAALVVLVGWPLPRTLPSADTFTQPFTTEVFVRILAVLVWLAWAQFTACVLVEVKGAVRGIGMPSRVPGSGASQALARQLVAAVLLLSASAASVAPVASDLARPASVVAAALQHTAADGAQRLGGAGGTGIALQAAVGDASAPIVDAEQAAAREAAARAHARADHVLHSAEDAPRGTKLYMVQPPEGRHHDSLWEIAERHLGNPRRWPEIYELNKDRTQPDGTRLTKASLIYPGWVLVMPADAHGGDLVEAVRHGAPDPSGSDPSGPGERGGHGARGGPGDDGSPGRDDRQHASTDVLSLLGGQTTGRVALGLMSAPLLSAGLLAALGARRRRALWQRAFGARPLTPGGWSGAEEALRVGADPEAARFLDAALRTLGADLAAAGRPLPAVYAARLDADGVDLLLSPAEPDAPAPWRAERDGRAWRLDRYALPPGAPPPGAAAPYPGLVSLGADLADLDAANAGQAPCTAGAPAERTVLVDLEAASGLIALVGADAERRREVLAALAAELAVNPWADGLRLTLVGFGAELKVLAPDRVRTAATLDAVLGDLERESAERTRALSAAGLDSVLSGRAAPGGGQAWAPHYVVVAEPPTGETAERFAALAASAHRTAITHLVGGPVAGAAWEWHVDDAERRLTVPLLDLAVRPQLLPSGAYAELVGLFRESGRMSRTGPAAGAAEDAPPPMPTARPAVEVGVLGPLTVRGAGTPEPERPELCREALVYLALHRDGVHPHVLGSALWPRGVTEEVRDAVLRRLGGWLGADASGAPHLLREADGRLRLGPQVLTDRELFRALLGRAEESQGGAEESWAQALSLVRGTVLEDRPAGRYGWLAHDAFEDAAAAEIADTALRLAAKRLQGGRPDAAADAVRAGLRGNPDDESLWYALLRTTHATGDGERLRAVVDRLLTHLRDRVGVPEPDARMAATLDEILPSWRG